MKCLFSRYMFLSQNVILFIHFTALESSICFKRISLKIMGIFQFLLSFLDVQMNLTIMFESTYR